MLNTVGFTVWLPTPSNLCPALVFNANFMAFINGCARIEVGHSIGNAQTCRYFTLLGARGMASRSVFQLTNQTRLGVLEPWRAFCVALHVKFTESR